MTLLRLSFPYLPAINLANFSLIFNLLYLFKFESSGIQLIIFSFLFNKIVMASSFDYSSVLHYHYSLGIAHCRESVGYYEYRSAVHKGIPVSYTHLVNVGVITRYILISYNIFKHIANGISIVYNSFIKYKVRDMYDNIDNGKYRKEL